ncbi:MAG TPA: STAS domain-containing protein [Acidimicrobiales bacterium]|nr:STAS domain-containing protein [Acidimicrobiales bacterium]
MATTLTSDTTDGDADARLARAALAAVVEHVNRGLVVELRGELDVVSAPGLRRRMLALVERHDERSFVLDLRGLTFVGTAGLAVLVVIERAVRRRGGRLTLVGLSPAARRLLQVAGLDEVFTVA